MSADRDRGTRRQKQTRAKQAKQAAKQQTAPVKAPGKAAQTVA